MLLRSSPNYFTQSSLMGCPSNTLSTFPHNIIKTTRLQSKLLHIKAAPFFFHNIRRNTSSTARLDLSSLNRIHLRSVGHETRLQPPCKNNTPAGGEKDHNRFQATERISLPFPHGSIQQAAS